MTDPNRAIFAEENQQLINFLGEYMISKARAALAQPTSPTDADHISRAAELLQQRHPAPAGAVADSVAVLEREAEAAEQGNLWMAPSELRHAATLLRQQQLRIALLEQRQAAPLAQCCPTPVPVADRPWEREGWCDEQGQCWVGDPGGGGFIPSWRLCRPEDAPNMKVSLPANALPLPAGEGEK